MRSESEVLEEFEVLKKKEKELLDKVKKDLLKGEPESLMESITSMMVFSSVLSFITWILGHSELRFSTLMDIEEVTKKGLDSGKPMEDVLAFAMDKIKELGEKKDNKDWN
jgi:hypothetical protein